MTDGGHVHTDLMRTPRLERALHEGVGPAEALEYMIVRHRRAAIQLIDGLLLPVLLRAAERCIHGALVLPEVPDHDRHIATGDGVDLQLRRE